MKSACRAMLLVLAAYCTGCSYAPYAYHNLVSAPIDRIQERAFRMRIRHTARSIWHDIRQHDKKEYSTAYAQGFEDGFVDYVDRNGSGEPPAMPPLYLRRESWRSGPNDIEDWYAGFRHGASAATESGLREQMVVPVGRPPRPASGSGHGETSVTPSSEPLAKPKPIVRDSLPAPKPRTDTPAAVIRNEAPAPKLDTVDQKPDPSPAPIVIVPPAPAVRDVLDAPAEKSPGQPAVAAWE